MDEQDQNEQALMEMFRRDRSEAEAHPPRTPRWRLSSRALAWLLALALVIFVLGPAAFLVIYPRFGPVDTMTSFCTAEGEGEYDTAYAKLSTRVQQHMTLDVFTRVSRSANLMSCSADNGIPIIFGGTQASLDDVTFQFSGDANGDTNAVVGSMTFVREHGEWHIDSMTPDLLLLSS